MNEGGPPAPVPDDLGERVARLEAQVAWLLERQAPGVRPAAPPAARMPPPIARPRAMSPVVWIAGVGAVLFLAGAVFFFHWAVEQGWMGPGFRFALGVLAGSALTALAARLVLGPSRRLGVALLLAGLGTLQFSFRAGAFAFHLS